MNQDTKEYTPYYILYAREKLLFSQTVLQEYKEKYAITAKRDAVRLPTINELINNCKKTLICLVVCIFIRNFAAEFV